MIRLGVLFILVLLIAGAARVVGILSFLIILGGIVSYLGDLLGSYFGKRRLSIFGLRPKNTGTLISLMTGTMITIATLGGAMLISEDYKDALLNYRKLKSDQESLVRINQDLKTNEEKLTRVNSELKSKEVELTRVLEGVEASFDRISGELKEAEEVRAGLAEEIEELRRDKEEKLEQIRLLARALKQKESGLIVITKNRDLSKKPHLVPFDSTRLALESAISVMLGEIKETVEAVGVAVDLPPEDRVNREIVDPLWKTLNEIKAVYATIATSDPTFPAPADCVLRPVSQQNLSYGEKLPRVYFDIQPNRVIFATGDEIARTRFDGTLDKAILLEQFFQFDKRVQDKLLRMGVLEASLTRKLDQISAGLLLNFSEIVNQIRQLRKWVTVRMVAQDAIKVYGEIDAVYQLGKADEHSDRNLEFGAAVEAEDDVRDRSSTGRGGLRAPGAIGRGVSTVAPDLDAGSGPAGVSGSVGSTDTEGSSKKGLVDQGNHRTLGEG